jgi:hypothetical protein
MSDNDFLDFLDERRLIVRDQYVTYVRVRNRLFTNAAGFLMLSVVLFYGFTWKRDVFFLFNVLTFMSSGLTVYSFYKWILLIRSVRIKVGPDTILSPRRAHVTTTAEYEMVKRNA